MKLICYTAEGVTEQWVPIWWKAKLRYISGYSFLLLINNKYTLTTSNKNQMCRPKQICHPEFKTILPCGCCPCKYQISNRYASVAELMRYSKSTGHRLRFLPNSTPGEGPIKISFERLPEQASKDQPSRTRSRNTPRTSTPRISAPRISTPRTFILPKIKQTWNQLVDVLYQIPPCCISYAPVSLINTQCKTNWCSLV